MSTICEICGKEYTCESQVVEHMHIVHYDDHEKVYECEICRMQFYSLWAIRGHMNTHIIVKAHNCKSCGKHFRSETDAEEHVFNEQIGKVSSTAISEISANLNRYGTTGDVDLDENESNHNTEIETGEEDFEMTDDNDSNLRDRPSATENDRKKLISLLIENEKLKNLDSEDFENDGQNINKIHNNHEDFGDGEICRDTKEDRLEMEEKAAVDKKMIYSVFEREKFETLDQDFPKSKESNSDTSSVNEDTVLNKDSNDQTDFGIDENVAKFLAGCSDEDDNDKKDEQKYIQSSRLTCEICKKTLGCPSSFKAHLLTHENTKPYSCEICGKNFKRRSHVKEHQLVHEPGKRRRSFTCHVCQKSFLQMKVLKMHLKLHTDIKPYVCEICKKAFRRNSHLKEHAVVHKKDRDILHCTLCKSLFMSQRAYNKHMNEHTFGKQFKCDLCNQQFRRKKALIVHISRHHSLDGKQISCEICQKKFTSDLDLKTHMNKHESFQCDICKKCFKRKDYLKKHRLNHDEDHTNFQCKICSKTYCSSKSLEAHMGIHQNGRQFQHQGHHASFVKEMSLTDRINKNQGKPVEEGTYCHEATESSLVKKFKEEIVADTCTENRFSDDKNNADKVGNEKSLRCDEKFVQGNTSEKDQSEIYDLLPHLDIFEEETTDSADQEKVHVTGLHASLIEFSHSSKSTEVDSVLNNSLMDPTITANQDEKFKTIDNTHIEYNLPQLRVPSSKSKAFIQITLPFKTDEQKGAYFEPESKQVVKGTKSNTVHERSLICEKCGRIFTTSHSLIRHVQYTHSDKRLFICEVCGAEYKQVDHLKNHFKRWHEEAEKIKRNTKVHVLK